MQTRAAIRSLALVVLTGVVLAPGVAPAQDLAGITGTAVDETQAALPRRCPASWSRRAARP